MIASLLDYIMGYSVSVVCISKIINRNINNLELDDRYDYPHSFLEFNKYRPTQFLPQVINCVGSSASGWFTSHHPEILK